MIIFVLKYKNNANSYIEMTKVGIAEFVGLTLSIVRRTKSSGGLLSIIKV